MNQVSCLSLAAQPTVWSVFAFFMILMEYIWNMGCYSSWTVKSRSVLYAWHEQFKEHLPLIVPSTFHSYFLLVEVIIFQTNDTCKLFFPSSSPYYIDIYGFTD